MLARMNLLLDAPDQELWMDEINRGTTTVDDVRLCEELLPVHDIRLTVAAD